MCVCWGEGLCVCRGEGRAQSPPGSLVPTAGPRRSAGPPSRREKCDESSSRGMLNQRERMSL